MIIRRCTASATPISGWPNRQPRLSADQVTEACAQRAAGTPLAAIARHFAVSAATVRHHTDRFAPPGGWPTRRLTEPQRNEAARLRAGGEIIAQIARHFGVTERAVYRHVKNVPPPPGGWARHRTRQLTADEIAHAITWRRGGETLEEIARALLVTVNTLHRAIRNPKKT